MIKLKDIVIYPILILYYIIYHYYKKLFPRKTFNLFVKNHRDGCKVRDDEWKYETSNVADNLLFEGSSPDGTAFYLEVTCKDKYQIASLYFIYKGQTFQGQFSGRYIDNKTISCGPVHLELREPFRQWRISFKGHLTNILNNDKKFISFGGWWKPTSDARFFYTNASIKSYSSIIMADPRKVADNLNEIKKIRDAPIFYQDGQYHFEFTIEKETVEICLRGLRTRNPSNIYSSSDQFYVYLEDGNRIQYATCSFDNQKKITHGYITRADRLVKCIKLLDPEALDITNHRLLEFSVERFPNFGIRKDEVISQYEYLNGNNQIVTVKRLKVVSGLSKGIALIRTVRESLAEDPVPEFQFFEDYHASTQEKSRRCLPFKHRACQDKLLAGGKGANLARLTTIEEKFKVPSGIVLTTTAFNEHINNHIEIKKLVDSLSNSKQTLEEQIQIGERIQESLKHSFVSPSLLDDIADSGLDLDENILYAVRSSAVGEDGADLSSAGQLESCLNIPVSELSRKIVECWCSNYRREVISYRRNYGQIVNPSMAVVIQEMKVGGIAGVMFTCDPVTNNDSFMVLNAIKGMGEDIVSGSVTPDEISINKNDWSFKKPNPCCLNNESLDKLGKVGLFLEKTFGKAQDIEFVVKDNKIYLVQTRDVTGRDAETKFELETEFDSGILSDLEVITTANLGEVVPFSLTPFECTTFGVIFDKNLTMMGYEPVSTYMSRQSSAAITIAGGRLLLNVGELFLRVWHSFEKDRLGELSIAGTELFSKESFLMAKQRYAPLPSYFDMKRLSEMVYCLFMRSKSELKAIHKSNDEMIASVVNKPASAYTFEELFELWDKQLLLQNKMFENHANISSYSSFTYVIVGMLIRGSEHGEMSPEMMSDFAELFSNCSNVISADIPVSFKKIAKAIHEDGLEEEFLNLSANEAIEFIQTKGKESKIQLNKFVKVHGHRGNRELYIRGVSWGEDPSLIIPNIHTILKSKQLEEETKIVKTTEEIIDNLTCKPTGIRKTFMKYMAKKTHEGVINREASKTCLVRGTYNMRKTPTLIRKKLVEEGYVPNEELCYFLTIDEILDVIQTRNAKLIARAQRRQKVFAGLEARQYNHIMYGRPVAISENTHKQFQSVNSLKGTVVCRGKVIARARVAKNLAEAQDTQPGEVLITCSTDICWSPFFPIINGIITEIGGLLSHGAVVAREYGIPSLIAVEHATDVFKTGDLVELNTDLGTISKIVEND